ncbi:MarR family protein [Candidatus Desulfosporosinus infrequens]|uniref:MarR family protein n=1 Tax=Candidatus Desulfosporosinus infrequens TaxID=2043169 RepID=A0A2U3KQZ6_9FIRM|nr:MarR family protein [Candidatus Desulfosporosinus infrequens]
MENINDSAKVAKLFQEVMHLYKQSMSKVFEATGITAPQGMVLGVLSKEKTLKITELSSKLGLSNSTVSGIVDRLEKQGMVERKRSEQDKRVVYVDIANDFKEMHHNFHQRIEQKIEAAMSKGTPEELAKIFEGLDALKKLLGGCKE